jgi:GNAT superfamily N-acetyltransferase
MIEGPRAARLEELPDVIRLSNHVFYPDGRIVMEQVLPTLFTPSNAHNLRVVVEDGKPVAMAGMTVNDLRMEEVSVRAACFGSVCTLESHRGRGLAAALMDDGIAHAVSQGASLALISGKRGLYSRMKCIDAGLFRVAEVDGRAGIRGKHEVREWEESDIPAMDALHSRESVRFLRPPGEMAALLRARAMFCRPARTWVVLEAGHITAYLCVSGPDDRTGPGVVLSRELAGSREAVLDAAAAVLEAESAQRLDIEVPASDELVRLAAERGLAGRVVGRHGTLKVVHRAAFLEAIASRVLRCARPLPEEPEDLAAVVFGSADRPAPAEPGGPFPLPLPGYGLNYI